MASPKRPARVVRSRGDCFIIGPLRKRDRWQRLLQKVVLPATRQCHLVPIAADALPDSGRITSQILQHLRDDRIVIADLTGGNPNVFYELAIRHATMKQTIMLVEVGFQVPFDVSAYRCAPIDLRDDRRCAASRQGLAEMLCKVLVPGAPVNNLVSDALQNFSLAKTQPGWEALQNGLASLRELAHRVAALERAVAALVPNPVPPPTDAEILDVMDAFWEQKRKKRRAQKRSDR